MYERLFRLLCLVAIVVVALAALTAIALVMSGTDVSTLVQGLTAATIGVRFNPR